MSNDVVKFPVVVPLSFVLESIAAASAVIIDDNVVTYARLEEDDEVVESGKFLELEGLLEFYVKDNQQCQMLDQSTFRLISSDDGMHYDVKCLVPATFTPPAS